MSTGRSARRATGASRRGPTSSPPIEPAEGEASTSAKTRTWLCLYRRVRCASLTRVGGVHAGGLRSLDRKEDAAAADSDEYDDFGRKKKKFRAGKKCVVQFTCPPRIS